MTHYRATYRVDEHEYQIEVESPTNHLSADMSTIMELINEKIEISKIQYDALSINHKIVAIEYSADGIHWSEIPDEEIKKTWNE